MTELVRFVFSVGGIAVFGLAAALWILFRPHSRLARRYLLCGTAFYLVATVYVSSFVLSRLLLVGLQPFDAAEVKRGPTAIVVMGAGSYTIQDWDGNEYSSTDGFAASRVLEAVRIYRREQPDWIISSGGKVRPDDRALSTGLAMRDLLIQFGVPPDRVLTETNSRNTHEEAVAVGALLAKLKVERMVLVTSDFHMRRSLGAFRAVGIQAVPAIVRDPFPPESWRDWILPGADGLWRSDLIVHELLGIGYYAVRGWYRF